MVEEAGTKSSPNKNTLGLLDLIDVNELQSLQDRLADATEISSVVIDPDGNCLTDPTNFNPVCRLIWETERGRELCRESDRVRNNLARESRQPLYHRCLSCGFLDASVPIVVDDRHLANWLVGQVNCDGLSRQHIESFARRIGADVNAMGAAFERMPGFSIDKLQSVLELVREMASELALLGHRNLRLRDDIRRRDESNRSLATVKERLQRLLRMSPAVIFRCGPEPDFGILYVSENSRSRLGYATEDFLDDPGLWRSRVHPEDLAQVGAARRQLVEGREGTVE